MIHKTLFLHMHHVTDEITVIFTQCRTQNIEFHSQWIMLHKTYSNILSTYPNSIHRNAHLQTYLRTFLRFYLSTHTDVYPSLIWGGALCALVAETTVSILFHLSITWHDITFLHCITSQNHITSHHITSHHITLDYIHGYKDRHIDT